MASQKQTYWKKNLRYLTILLLVWFAQQGSIYTFVILIFVYIFLMNKLDNQFNKKGD